jgi:hypothetical protein
MPALSKLFSDDSKDILDRCGVDKITTSPVALYELNAIEYHIFVMASDLAEEASQAA